MFLACSPISWPYKWDFVLGLHTYLSLSVFMLISVIPTEHCSVVWNQKILQYCFGSSCTMWTPCKFHVIFFWGGGRGISQTVLSQPQAYSQQYSASYNKTSNWKQPWLLPGMHSEFWTITWQYHMSFREFFYFIPNVNGMLMDREFNSVPAISRSCWVMLHIYNITSLVSECKAPSLIGSSLFLSSDLCL